MDLAALYPYVISTGALLLAAATFVRAGRWKDSEEARVLVDKVNEIDSRVTSVETKIGNLATKADIATVTAELNGLEKVMKVTAEAQTTQIKGVDEAVSRIENFLRDGGARK